MPGTTCVNTIARINYEYEGLNWEDAWEEAEAQFKGTEEEEIHNWCVKQVAAHSKLQGDSDTLSTAAEWLYELFAYKFGDDDKFYYDLDCYFPRFGESPEAREKELYGNIINKIAERLEHE